MEPVASFGIFEWVIIYIFAGITALVTLEGAIAVYFFLRARNNKE
jgi:hypothetical protein